MVTSPTISKQFAVLQSMDFNLLREKGIAYAQELAGTVWTDYNAHDPGVTILEVLCYAITDLGYRLNFDTKDLLAQDTASRLQQKKDFFTAREIFTCNPVTVTDFRKLLIDNPKIKNAWLEPAGNQEGLAFYVDKENEQLVAYPPYETSTGNEDVDKQNAEKNDAAKRFFNGLYDVTIEFIEESDGFTKMNDNTAEGSLTIDVDGLDAFEVDVEISGPFWDEIETQESDFQDPEAYLQALRNEIRRKLINVSVSPAEQEVGSNAVILSPEVSSADDYAADPNLASYIIKVDITQNDIYGTRLEELSEKVQVALYQQVGLGDSAEANSLVDEYAKKVIHIRGILASANRTLHAHRNLCEDYSTFKTLKREEIGICADILIDNEAVVDTVQAQIYYKIEKFLSPGIKFYTLAEMLAKTDAEGNRKYTSDEIFEGPRLKHGFIDTEELLATERRKVIHTSDLYQEIMDVPGVVAVQSLTIRNFPKGNDLIEQNTEAWCLQLAFDQNYIPKLGIDQSTITFYKDSIPYFANKHNTEVLLDALKQQDAASQGGPSFEDIEIPKGRDREVQDYFSIQNEFPLAYGVGEDSLPGDSSDLRKAQAKQLKAYLLFFEQLLADYFAQLANVRKLFSIDASIDKTYFTQPLYEVPEVWKLFKDLVASSGPFDKMPPAQVEAAWQAYIANPDNAYMSSLYSETEEGPDGPEKTPFYKRRNRFLDHLMARFNEQFTDYTLIMYEIFKEKAQDDLIEDKLKLLTDYGALSYNRGKGFDYTNPFEVWDTPNVTGLQHRLCRLLGIDNYWRRNLSNFTYAMYQEHDLDTRNEMRFRLFDKSGEKIMLSSSTRYESPAHLLDELHLSMVMGTDLENFEFKVTVDNRHYFNVVDKSGEVISRRIEYFDTKQEAEQAAKELRNYLRHHYSEEGMFVIEHLLLRPQNADDQYMQVCLDNDCTSCTDPYSFRITVIAPAYTERFANRNFRRYFEKMVRMETPAHIHPKVCWISRQDMDRFELAYYEWLLEKSGAPSELTSPDLLGHPDAISASELYRFQQAANRRQREMAKGKPAGKSKMPGDTDLDKLVNGVHDLLGDFSELNHKIKQLRFYPAIYEDWDTLRKATTAVKDALPSMSDVAQVQEAAPMLGTVKDAMKTFRDRFKAERKAYDVEDTFIQEALSHGDYRAKAVDLAAKLVAIAGQILGAELAPEDQYYAFLEGLEGFIDNWYEVVPWLDGQTFDQEKAQNYAELKRDMKGLRKAVKSARKNPSPLLLTDLGTAASANGGHIMHLVKEAVPEGAPEPEGVPAANTLPNHSGQVPQLNKLNHLLKVLSELTNIYPVATLFDCEEGGGDSPIQLDNTILGTLNTTEHD